MANDDYARFSFPPVKHLHCSPLAGGDFMAAARVTKTGNAVILDPWDGTLTEIPAAA